MNSLRSCHRSASSCHRWRCLMTVQGYKTKVGEGGIKLSGGQRQRIAIARSIIKKPPILILDEATSSIDVRGEGIVQAALDRVSKGRTTITIAHRLSTVKKADNIIVLRNGKAVEQGTHHSLLQDPEGVYFKLVHAQNLETTDDNKTDDVHGLEAVEQALQRERSEAVDVSRVSDEEDRLYKKRGIIPTIWLFIRETRPVWPWYFLVLACTMVCGGRWPFETALRLSGNSIVYVLKRNHSVFRTSKLAVRQAHRGLHSDWAAATR